MTQEKNQRALFAAEDVAMSTLSQQLKQFCKRNLKNHWINKMQIEKNIPIPATYPFKDMEVGDSFLVPEEVNRAAVTNSARRFGKNNEMEFTVRAISGGRLRCWRTA